MNSNACHRMHAAQPDMEERGNEDPSHVARPGGSGGADARGLQPGVRARRPPAQARPPPPAAPATGELTMWERSGGNKQMVDMLVEAWNTKNPDCKINLTYIPHTEMVGKIAQGIASGDVPDLMGMDLIYAPQFEKAQQLVDITDRISAWPELEDRQQGPHDGRDLRGPALRRPAVRRRVGPVLQQGPVHEGRARPGQAADQPGRAARRTPTRSPPWAATSRATTCRATAPAATSSPSVR